MVANTSFNISGPLREGSKFYCEVTSGVLSSSKKIYGLDASNARENACQFVTSINDIGPSRGPGFIAASTAVALPYATGLAIADGPSPLLDVVGIVLLLGAVSFGVYKLITARTAEEEAACEEQYATDGLVCLASGSRACWAQAANRFGDCLAGRPLRPLVW